MLAKLKQLSKETALYGLSTVLGRFINFILVPFYSNIFLPNDLGIVSNIYAYIGLLNIIFIYGMDSGFLKMASLPEYKGKKDVFTASIIMVTVTSLVLELSLFLFKGTLIGFLGGTPQNAQIISKSLNYTFIILILDALCVIPFIYLRLESKSVLFSSIRILNILVNVCLNLVLILGFKMGIEAVFISNLVASIVALLALLPHILKNIEYKIDFTLLKRILKFGLPFFPGGIGAMLIQVVDKPIVEKLTDYNTLGIYHANYKMGILMMLFVNMFQFAWQPFFLKNSTEKDSKQVFSKVFTYFALLGTIVVVVTSLFINDIVRITIFGKHILGKAYWGGTEIIPIVLLGYLFYGFYIIFNSGFYIKEKSLIIPVIMGGGAIINVASNYLLIPVFNISGAAIATLLAYTFVAYAAYRESQKIYFVEYESVKVLKIAVIFAFAAAAYYLLPLLGTPSIPSKIIILIVFFDMIILSGIFSKKFLRVIFA